MLGLISKIVFFAPRIRHDIMISSKKGAPYGSIRGPEY